MAELTFRVRNPRIATKKRCLKCKKVLLAEDFYKYRYLTNQLKLSYRLAPTCKNCSNAQRRISRKLDPERQAEITKRYKVKHAEEIREWTKAYRQLPENKRRHAASENIRRMKGVNRSKKSDMVAIDEALELARFGDRYLDAYSGELIDKPTVDHIIPLKSGGSHDSDNLCVTSRINNISKHVKPLIIWMAYRRRKEVQSCLATPATSSGL